MKDQPLLIYIHGFKSSANAHKAQLIGTFIDDNKLSVEYLRPDLNDYPVPAIEQLCDLIEAHLPRPIYLIGSSLGGFYARYLMVRYDLTAVLLNPAVRPHELMHGYLGENTNPYSGQQFTLTPTHMDDLKSLSVDSATRAQQTLVILQTGDEVLDATEASHAYYRSTCWIEYGGDHQFQGFEKYIGPLFHWLGML